MVGKAYRLYGIAGLLSSVLMFMWNMLASIPYGWRIYLEFNAASEGPLELAIALTSLPAIFWIAVREFNHDHEARAAA